MDSRSKVEIKEIEPSIGVHAFTTTIAEKVVKFEVIKFKDSIFLWIGEKLNRKLDDLSLALNSHCSSQPVCTKIMGEPTDLTSNNLSIKLSKKLGKPVYVSFNLVNDRLTVPIINSRIAEEIKKYPQFF